MCCRSKTTTRSRATVYRTGSRRVSSRKTSLPQPPEEGYEFKPQPERKPVYRTLRQKDKQGGSR